MDDRRAPPHRVPAKPSEVSFRARTEKDHRREAFVRQTHVGTSGWQYRDWRGTFYPRDVPQREWLPYFASHF